MEYTDQQLAEFKTEFARRKRNQFIAAAPVIAVILAFAFFERQLKQAFEGVSPAISGGVLILAFVGLLAFSLRNWRCPACNSYLGKSTSMKHCPKCGVVLK